ncbi:LemA family protein [Actinoplanes sp. NPDC051411]|uniref:LemA family protein n=1 Tax=Actinoplanes sp. NPDC051411 TaxID=3155522 RepID=UPI00342A1CC9
MPVALIVVLALLLVLAGAAADLFILIAGRNRAAHSWRTVDTLLQRRHTLIGMLLDDARSPEAGPVRAARRAAISAGVLTDPAGTCRAEEHLTATLTRLVDAAGRDPGLRGDARLHAPLDRLRALDEPLRAAVDDFNGQVTAYRRTASRFPGPLLASAFDLRPLSAYAVSEPAPEPRRSIVAPAGEPA